MGRLGKISYSNAASANSGDGNTGDAIVETYGYTTAGEISSRSLSVSRLIQGTGGVWTPYSTSLTLQAAYDTEGHRNH